MMYLDSNIQYLDLDRNTAQSIQKIVPCPICNRKVLLLELEIHVSAAHLVVQNPDKNLQFLDCRGQLLIGLRMLCVSRTNLFVLRSRMDENSQTKSVEVAQSSYTMSPSLPESIADLSFSWRTDDENACQIDRNASGVESSQLFTDTNDDDDEYADEWCTCKRWKREKMIACDAAPNCPVEWFHYSCVGIRRAPKGKWYCPSCCEGMKIAETIDETIKKASPAAADEVEADEEKLAVSPAAAENSKKCAECGWQFRAAISAKSPSVKCQPMTAHVWGHLRRSSKNSLCAFSCLHCLVDHGNSTKAGILEHVRSRHKIEIPAVGIDYSDLRPNYRTAYLKQWMRCFPEVDESSMDNQSIEEICFRYAKTKPAI